MKLIVVNNEIARQNLINVEHGFPLTIPFSKLMENELFYKAYKKAYQKTDKYKAYQKAYQKAYKKAYQKTDKYKAYKKAYYLKNKEIYHQRYLRKSA